MQRFTSDGRGYPSSLMLEGNLSTLIPRYSWALDRSGMATSGAGLADDSLRRCLGEFFERRHFYHETIATGSGPLSSKLAGAELESFQNCLEQTCHSDFRDRISQHNFLFFKTVILPTWETREVPAVFISMDNTDLALDRPFLPLIDTSGCAVHFELDKAIHSSIRELIERQYLLRYWLTNEGAIDVTEEAQRSISPHSGKLMEIIAETGNIKILDISCDEVAGTVVLAVMSGTESSTVKYCVGLSYASGIPDAADRAVKELWQSYIFLMSMSGVEDSNSHIHDRYHRYFLECNRLDVATQMLSGISCRSGDRAVTREGIIESVTKRFGPIYAYIKPARVLERDIWCVRTFTPNAFIHLDNSRNFNLRNDFSNNFINLIKDDRLEMMVPFP